MQRSISTSLLHAVFIPHSLYIDFVFRIGYSDFGETTRETGRWRRQTNTGDIRKASLVFFLAAQVTR